MKAIVVILLFLCTGCAPKFYYPVVSHCFQSDCRITIDRGIDQIVFFVQDSTLQVGDTVKFTKGVLPVQVRIESEPDPGMYIIP